MLVLKMQHFEDPSIGRGQYVNGYGWHLYHYATRTGCSIPLEGRAIAKHVDSGLRGGDRCSQSQITISWPPQDNGIHFITTVSLLTGVPVRSG